jgi:hypothetical protein
MESLGDRIEAETNEARREAAKAISPDNPS